MEIWKQTAMTTYEKNRELESTTKFLEANANSALPSDNNIAGKYGNSTPLQTKQQKEEAGQEDRK